MPPPWPHGDPDRLVRTILAGPRYAHVREAPDPDLSSRVISAIADAIRAVLAAIERNLGATSGAGTVVGWILIASACSVLLLLIAVVLRRWAERRSIVRAGVARSATRQSSSLLRARAAQAAAAARWHEATTALFLAALAALDEAGRVPFDATRTVGEVRRLVREPAFDVFAGAATVALFARGGPDAERYATMDRAYGDAFREGA